LQITNPKWPTLRSFVLTFSSCSICAGCQQFIRQTQLQFCKMASFLSREITMTWFQEVRVEPTTPLFTHKAVHTKSWILPFSGENTLHLDMEGTVWEEQGLFSSNYSYMHISSQFWYTIMSWLCWGIISDSRLKTLSSLKEFVGSQWYTVFHRSSEISTNWKYSVNNC
jgi:hypothetical protein